MPFTVSELRALEVLDSRGRPTLAVTLTLDGHEPVRAGVPSGASTGSGEAVERRDGDPRRYDGLGVLGAVSAVNAEIASALRGWEFADLTELDHHLIDLDGTPDKSRLGANALVGVSIAAARAIARATTAELWQHVAAASALPPRLPVPHFNVINGGAHASNALDFQEFMLAPLGAPNLREAIRAGAEIYLALRRMLIDRGLDVGLGDEGGFAPDISQPEHALDLLVRAIDGAGYRAGRDGVAIAMDPAATEFCSGTTYTVAGERLSTNDMIDRYETMVTDFPIWSIEDGLSESDITGWKRLTERLDDRVQLIGDDLLVTDPSRITEAITQRTGNAALIKVNQIGTVTETLDAIGTCQQAGWKQMISHRSGETEDSFIADLAVGSGCGQIKAGAPSRGERIAKYNRLLEIEAVAALPYGLG